MKVDRSWYWPDAIKIALIAAVILGVMVGARERGFSKTEAVTTFVVTFAFAFWLGRKSVVKRYDGYDPPVAKPEDEFTDRHE